MVHLVPGTWSVLKWMQPTPRGRAHFVIWRMLLPPPRTQGMCWPTDSLAGFRARCNPSSLLGTQSLPLRPPDLRTRMLQPWLRMPNGVSRRYFPSSVTCPLSPCVPLPGDGPSLLQDGCVNWPSITQQSLGNCFYQERNKLICLGWIMSPCAPCKSDHLPKALGLDGSVNNFTTTIILQFWIFSGNIMHSLQ